ncbi:unnamed protein product [Calypogeia fissa]
MSPEPAKLGRVPSLFPHVHSLWWKEGFNAEMFLRTDGDCVEDPAVTESECKAILDVPGVRELLAGHNPRVLDLCCGQGRHTIHLAQAYGSAEFHGRDAQAFLIDLAKTRAESGECKNVTFTVGDARQIPVSDGQFDIVIVMGNSFGYLESDEQHVAFLQEVSRVLKPGGRFLIDLPKAEWLRSNYSTHGWEWIPGGPIESKSTDRRMLACRERELAPGGKWLASREIVVDLDKGVCNDLFYRIRLYDLDEMNVMLEQCGMTLLSKDGNELTGNNQPHTDMGFMAHRDLLVARKRLARVDQQEELNFVAEDGVAGFEDNQQGLTPDQPVSCPIGGLGTKAYTHPNLTTVMNAQKGRCYVATGFLGKGSILLRDPVYVMVPKRPLIVRFCSRPECSKPIHDAPVSCLRGCFEDVHWCSTSCRDLDSNRHSLECSWISEFRAAIVSEYNEYDFTMLWLAVRLLARRYLELRKDKISRKADSAANHLGSPTVTDWTSFWESRSNEDITSPDRLQHRRMLAEKYLQDLALTENLDVPYLASIISREQTNSFYLSKYSQTEPRVSYGCGVYLTGQNFNHSCSPNVRQRPDDNGHMVFQALRDIEEGEECCISYFELKEYVTLKERRKMLEDFFQFTCMCEKCVEEEGEEGKKK